MHFYIDNIIDVMYSYCTTQHTIGVSHMSMTDYENKLGDAISRLDNYIQYATHKQINNTIQIRIVIATIACNLKVNERDLLEYYTTHYQ